MALSLATVLGNDFRYMQSSHRVPGPTGDLKTVITTPPGASVGTVVMIHGDGPIDATHGGLYAPWFEAAADAGFATVSWSKPGVAGSAGNWEHQSMEDRADEVEAVLSWLATEGAAPSDHVVLWAASQGGWVFPRVAQKRPEVEGVVAVGTAINWLTQGRYHLDAELDAAGADAATREEAIAVSDRVRSLLRDGAEYAEYLAAMDDLGQEEVMTADRWTFAGTNLEEDATEDLHRLAARDLSVVLLAGDHDLNVDTAETERVYRDALGEDLSVERFDAPHSLARPIMESTPAIGAATAIVWPRALTAPGVLEAYTDALNTMRQNWAP